MSRAPGGAARVETVTVLVTDLVDSTSQRIRVGEAEADRLRARHDRLTLAAIARRGGRIVKHTGDGVLATFSGAAEALAAAVAIQQALWNSNVAQAEHLRVRIGISAGDVTIEGDDCFGLPVVEAQRLEMAAQPGQILCSALVEALAHGRAGVSVRPIGALELKGLARPLEAGEVLWAPVPSPASPLPPMLADAKTLTFAGRAEELAAMHSAWDLVVAGATRVVLVGGEPGIGKTRLAAEMARAAAADGGLVLAGRCDELVTAPYQPVAQALQWWLAQPGAVDVLGERPQELARLAPQLQSMLPRLPAPLDASSEAERLLLFDAVRSWLAQVTAHQPVLMVADDLHWAEMGTPLLLRHVAASDPVPRLLVVATYRDTDLDLRPQLSSVVADLRTRSNVTAISLGGLRPGEVAELVARVGEDDLPDRDRGLAAALHQETGGNPFFVGEVLRHLVEVGEAEGPGRWPASALSAARLPQGVREVVGRRLSLLPEPTQQALRTAAVIGTSFRLDLLAQVTGDTEDELLDALEPALSAHLLVERGVASFEFAHAIVRSTLHAELTSTRRARVHRSVAVALEQLPEAQRDAAVMDLAYHWLEAGPGAGEAKAVTYATRAAETAFANAAPEESARWYRQAREALAGSDPHLDVQLLHRLGEAEAVAFDPRWQETLLAAARAAEELGDLALMTDALCISRRTVFTSTSPMGADEEKIELLERALSRVGDDDLLRARLSAALAVELLYVGDVDRRLALVEESWRIADSIEDPVEWARTRHLVAGAVSMRLRPRPWYEQRLDQFEWALEAARDRGEREVEFWTLRDLFYTALFVGVPNRARVLGEAEEVLASYRHPFLEDDALVMRMAAAFVDGDVELGEDLGGQIARRWRAHGREEGAVHAGSARLQAARERSGLAAFLERLPPVPTAERELVVPSFSRALHAAVHHDAGQADEAYRVVEECSRNGFDDVPDDAARPVALCLWAEVTARVRHLPAARALHAVLAGDEGLHLASGGWYLGAVSRYTGLLAAALGRADEAEAALLDAEAAHRTMRSPPWLARTQLDHGDLLVARGDLAGARACAEAALEAIGDRPLEVSRQRAAALL
ncbi:MAG TPA: AAA family ATPase [Acidimicrobiales bacterium]|nr:AAA family ATPase [Acidimicrobiales bacterium]